MAREFDGTNDNISFASDTSIDDFTAKTIAFYVRRLTTGVRQSIMAKDRQGTGWRLAFENSLNGDGFAFSQEWSGEQFARWNGTTARTSTTAYYHAVLTYDGSSTANDPALTVDGVADTFTEDAAPVGSQDPDAAQNLLAGEDGAAGNDFHGQIGWFCYDNVIWTAAQINRHRWWGRIGGAVQVFHPLVTDSLVNKGTATADGTATGTTMVSIPRVMRPGCGGW